MGHLAHMLEYAGGVTLPYGPVQDRAVPDASTHTSSMYCIGLSTFVLQKQVPSS